MSPRRKHDQYFTPESAVAELLKRVPISPHHRVLEPCAGSGNIAVPLICHGCDVATNDIDPAMPADTHEDAADVQWWQLGLYDPRSGDVPRVFDWAVSNPPFSRAHQIVPLAYEHARLGVAMLLRLSFLEPVANRAEFLHTFPPTHLVVLPRISFTGNGKTDSVTCAWMVWIKDGIPSDVHVVPRAR
jgi:16S rRNA A1518/A1519 N6-dimethyltransferase RsmA/KsgA/DIM1 with predicted DNA glycosylase/AP lyase activity